MRDVTGILKYLGPVPVHFGSRDFFCIIQGEEGVGVREGEDCGRLDKLRIESRKNSMITEVTDIQRVCRMVDQATGLAYHKWYRFL